MASYRAAQVTRSGRQEVVERELTQPPPGMVRIRLEACGICHSDALEGIRPTIQTAPLEAAAGAYVKMMRN